MAMDSNNASEIIREIETLKSTKSQIETQISLLETRLHQLQNSSTSDKVNNNGCNDSCSNQTTLNSCCNNNIQVNYENGLSAEHIYRYSRHLLLPSFGVQAQAKLLKSSILVIGAGGLGSPALLYLAACGAGKIGIVDHDVVEMNNLQRQIIHTEAYIGRPKVESAAAACRAINSTIEIVEHMEAFRTSNALEIMSQYDIVIDATDNAPSRYMINDCCVVLGKPLISGAALGLEGQLTVYNYNGGPCYRCLFPTPPPSTACQRCADSGVLGVVPGVIGCLQALEAIKVAGGIGEPLSGRLLLLDALSGRIRIVKLRGRSSQCKSCGDTAALTKQQFQSFDYEKFTETSLSTSPRKLNLLPASARISSKEYNEKILKGEPHVLVDVRPAHHYEIVSLPNSINIPLSSLEKSLPDLPTAIRQEIENKGLDNSSGALLYVICRRGNDSQIAVEHFHKLGYATAKDIIGGLESWASDIDPTLPTY